jgi:rhodanese-related sulfurtransferase
VANKNTAVFGIYKSVAQAERAVATLTSAGFANNDISVLLTDAQSSHDFAHQKKTKAPEGTAAGATTGGIIGGALGLLAGIGTLAIPGVGPLIAAGPLLATLAGVGAGGAAGGIIGALAGMGIPEYEAKRYEGRVKNGGVLLSVHCDSSKRVTAAKELLKSTGAEDISATGEVSSVQETTNYAR